MVSKLRFILVTFVLVLLLNGFVTALNTKVNVKTDANRKVTLRFQDISGSGTLPGGTFLEIPTNEAGSASAVFSSDIYNKVDVSVMIRTAEGVLRTFPDGQPTKLFKGLKTGWVYDIDLTAATPSAVQVGKYTDSSGGGSTNTTSSTPANNSASSTNNSSTTNIENKTEETNKDNTKDTTSDKKEDTPDENNNEEETPTDEESSFDWQKIGMYAGIALFSLILVVAIVFVFLKMKSSNVSSKIYFGKPMNSKLSPKEMKILEDAQKKIIIAQNEINQIKDRDSKMRELEERIRKDRLELEKLRKKKIS